MHYPRGMVPCRAGLPLDENYLVLKCMSPAEKAFVPFIGRATRTAMSYGVRELYICAQYPVSGLPYTLDWAIGDEPEHPTLGVEVDGATWHLTPDAFRKDRIRDRRLAARGIMMIRFFAKEVMRGDPDVPKHLALVLLNRYGPRMGRNEVKRIRIAE